MARGNRTFHPIRPTMDRFWEKVSKGDGCWLWLGHLNTRGYGQFKLNRSMQLAHRVAWLFTEGEIPAGLFICHHCDNPRCVRPDHLFMGTRADNTRDMMMKNRQPRSIGTKNPRAKLTEAEVRVIRASPLTTVALGKRYGLRQQTISAVRVRQTWRHLP